jgi:hypothetical protein
VSLATGEAKSRQIAQSINRRMDLGVQAPTRTAKTLLPVFLGAPAACWCSRTMVLSRTIPQSLPPRRAWRKVPARHLCPPNARSA